MKTNVMQIVRLVMMIVAVAGIIYALEYMAVSYTHLTLPTT